MKQTTAIKKARAFVRLVKVGDGWAPLYYPLPWSRERATSGGDNPRPWDEARAGLVVDRARVALTLMGADGTGDGRFIPDAAAIDGAIEYAIHSPYGPHATTIAETVAGAVEWLAAGNWRDYIYPPDDRARYP